MVRRTTKQNEIYLMNHEIDSVKSLFYVIFCFRIPLLYDKMALNYQPTIDTNQTIVKSDPSI